MSTAAKATYTHLRDGSWGIRAEGKLTAGTSVTVTKRDGTTKTETIGKVLWTGADSKSGKIISLCSVTTSTPLRSSSSRPGICSHCGDRCNPRYRTCVECANGGMSYTDSHGNFVLGSDD